MKEGEVLKKHPLGAMLKFASRLAEKELNDKMAELNITRSQSDLLVYVFLKNKDGHEVNQVDIEKYLNLKNPTVSGLINRLEKKNYIERKSSNKGANFKSIVITSSGQKLLEEGKKIMQDAENSMFSVLTKDEKNKLEMLLKKIIENKMLNNYDFD